MTSVTVRDVTWNFADDETVGQYCNGDYWVVGPVTIISITPASVNAGGWIKNGTVVNPSAATGTGDQGFDNTISDGTLGPDYSALMNVDPGITGSNLVVTTGTVVKSISRSTTVGSRGGNNFPQLQGMEYLTVVSSAPEADAFRPPPAGTGQGLSRLFRRSCGGDEQSDGVGGGDV